MNPALLANLVALVHFAWVAFLVLGLAAILLGIAMRWEWVRNPWFRLVHLGMIAYVVGESLLGVACPLTVWEHRLRLRAGQRTLEGDFIAGWVHRLMFFQAEPWVFTTVYVAFGAAVLATLVLAPPRWRKKRGEAAGASQTASSP